MGLNNLKKLEIENLKLKIREATTYFEVLFSRNPNITPHLRNVVAKTARLVTMLQRLMPKEGGPPASRRKMIAATAE